ncbi:MAG: acyl carrier protein [Burkholderiales bacterium]|nr:acyl carrier protein [Burkholderiales bacterium]
MAQASRLSSRGWCCSRRWRRSWRSRCPPRRRSPNDSCRNWEDPVQSDEILARLTRIGRDVFEKPDLVLDRRTTARDVLAWDSLNHVRFVMEVERDFGVKFALGELQDLKDVGVLADLIARKKG